MSELARTDLESSPPEWFVEKWLLDGTPHLFSGNREQYIEWRMRSSELLGVPARDLILVGSAATGFSLTPGKNFRAFQSDSDIDLAIVSDYYFEIAWRSLLEAKVTTRSKDIVEALRRNKSNLLFYGTIVTDILLPLMPFFPQWEKASQELSEIEPTKGRTIEFRLYKNAWFLKDYLVRGVRKLQEGVLNASVSEDDKP